MAVDKIMERIFTDPEVCEGKPHIKGTEVMVYQVLDLLASGVFPQEIASARHFPQLTIEDVYLCVAYASQLVRKKKGAAVG